MYKEVLALNNLQWLMCHKTQTNQIIYIMYMYKEVLALNNLQWLICHKTQPNLLKITSHVPCLMDSQCPSSQIAQFYYFLFFNSV